MKDKLKLILDQMEQYNSTDMAESVFAFDRSTLYDAFVVAPGWKPDKIIEDPRFTVTQLSQHSYISSYLVERDGLKIAWMQCAAGAGNMIDHLTICGRLQIKSLIFIGAVGSLVPEFDVGDLCIPVRCISGVGANAYFCEKLTDYVPFDTVRADEAYIDKIIQKAGLCGYSLRKASVYCTDSISLEYPHLEEIRAFGTQLIEMETSSFYRLSELWEKPASALLVVSDNSTTGAALIGRTAAQQIRYDSNRKQAIPELIYQIAKDPLL